MSTKKTKVWTIIWDIIKAILTLGISHINKRKERVESTDDKNNIPMS